MKFNVPDDGRQVLLNEPFSNRVAGIRRLELVAGAVARDPGCVVESNEVGMNRSMLLVLVEPGKALVMIGDVQVVTRTEAFDEMKRGVEGNDRGPFGRQ